MGMTIEEIQQCLKEYHSGFTGYAGNFQEVVDGALNIMCKYQKIEELVEEWDKDLICYDGHYAVDYMEKIQEVIEDGKID